MKIVISCCKRKNSQPMSYQGKTIHFISNPDEKEKGESDLFVRPDDKVPVANFTWRTMVIDAQDKANNSLLPAYKLYKPHIYQRLYERFSDNLFIFSAGWGIVEASFKLPNYDISFSKSSDNCTRRLQEQVFEDFNALYGIHPDEDILFIGGRDYLDPFFIDMTKHLPNRKKIVYVGKKPDLRLNETDNYELIYYPTNIRTNWHYDYAKKELLHR